MGFKLPKSKSPTLPGVLYSPYNGPHAALLAIESVSVPIMIICSGIKCDCLSKNVLTVQIGEKKTTSLAVPLQTTGETRPTG